MRFACDTGGTFTDLVIEDDRGRVHMFKAPTTPADPVEGILDAVDGAAAGFGLNAKELLAQAESFVHGTTHAINAIITGNTAKTAFLTTQGRAIVKSCVWADHAAARSWRSPSTNLTPRMISARWFDPSSFLHFL